MTIAHREWVGEAWYRIAPRLLLLGDSHYVTDPRDDSPELTRDIITSVRDGHRRIPFYSKTEALCAAHLTRVQKKESAGFWDSTAFTNFVPFTVGSTFDSVPTAELWRAGGESFVQLLANLQPTHVLSLGQRQWNHIQFPTGWRSVPDPNDAAIRVWEGPGGDHIRATWVNHPSSHGFSVSHWESRVAALLNAN
jgi:hypothetical protein